MDDGPLVMVVGSLNVDLTLRVARLPAAGETLSARSAATSFGGKGANQALAAHRAGGRVRMIGCVGADDHGVRYRERLAEEGVDVEGIGSTGAHATGSAVIAVDDAGENTIIVDPGANQALDETHLGLQTSRFAGVAALLVQLECPLNTVRRATETARANGASVILNPSPWRDDLRANELRADVIIVNECEAQALTGEDPGTGRDDAGSMLGELQCGTLVVTRGARSTLAMSAEHGCFESVPPAVQPVDTVGAGDTFAGAFTVAHAEGRSLREAVAFANAAAALATLHPGAQNAIPGRDEILAFQSSQRTG